MKLVHYPSYFDAYRDDQRQRLEFNLDHGADYMDSQVRELRRLARAIAAIRKELYPTTKERKH